VALLVVEGGIGNGVIVVKERANHGSEDSQVDKITRMNHPRITPEMCTLGVHNVRGMRRVGAGVEIGNAEGVVSKRSWGAWGKVGGGAKDMVHDEDKGVELRPGKSNHGKIEQGNVPAGKTGAGGEASGGEEVGGGQRTLGEAPHWGPKVRKGNCRTAKAVPIKAQTDEQAPRGLKPMKIQEV